MNNIYIQMAKKKEGKENTAIVMASADISNEKKKEKVQREKKDVGESNLAYHITKRGHPSFTAEKKKNLIRFTSKKKKKWSAKSMRTPATSPFGL